MKKIVIIVIVILILLVSQVMLFYTNKQLHSNVFVKDSYLEELSAKYSVIEPQYALNVQNIGKGLDTTIVVSDSLYNQIVLSNYLNQLGHTVLVCRISDHYCKQCVDHAVSIITDNKNAFDFSKVVFLCNSSGRRVFKLQIREYGLEKMNFFDCGDLAIPIENIMFPYYMVIDSSLKVLAVYAPSKSTHGTDFDFKNVKLMYDNLVDN